MAIDLPGPVADFLSFIGITWPNVDEDKVREFGDHVAAFRASLDGTHRAATGTVTELGSSYRGAAYDQLRATWGRMSSSHLDELLAGCSVVSTSMGVTADVIVTMKLEALVQLAVMAAEFIAAQAAAVATLGIAEAGVALIEYEGRRLVAFLEQELTQYVIGQVIDAAVTPLIGTVERAVQGLVYQSVAAALGVPAGGSGAGSFAIAPDQVMAHARTFRSHAQEVAALGQTFTAQAGAVTFE